MYSVSFTLLMCHFYLQSNPIARWHVCQGSINSIAFSFDGAHLATVGRDGITSNSYNLHFVVVSFLVCLKFKFFFSLFICRVQDICECLIIRKNSLYVVAKVIMVLYYVVLGGALFLLFNFLNLSLFL